MGGDSTFEVHCGQHGAQPATFVCQHLARSIRTGVAVGFHVSGENPGTERPDAWCNDCERIRVDEGGEWNDRSETFAGITLLCGRCYDRAHAINT